MSRRLLAIAAAIVLALVGGGLVLGVTRSADERAVAKLDPVEVLVVGEEPIPEGTAAADLGPLVQRTTIPGTAAVPGHLTDLADVQDLVAATTMQPGEQLLTERFVAPEALDDEPIPTLPEDKHEITIPLEGHRALGGRLTPGETVGVTLSFADPARSHLHLHKVLVTSVQGAPMPIPAPGPEPGSEEEPDRETGPTSDDPDAPAPDPVPENSLLISLAVDTADVEEVVYAAEFGTIWLTREGEDVPDDPTAVVVDDDFWPGNPGTSSGDQE
jgi:pilus assembly protein CpaB